MAEGSPALWRLLQAAAGVVAAVRAGQSATQSMAAVPVAVRPGTQALAFHALRQLGRAQALRAQLARRPPPPQADALLCTALALCWDPAAAPYEPFTLVDQAVEAAKRDAATKAQASFINACLRRFLREREALVATTDRDEIARFNHPLWWIVALRKEHPRTWQGILAANNTHAAMTLRVNTRVTTVGQVLADLEGVGIAAARVGEQGVALAQPKPVHEIPGFAQGRVSVQDAAAQLAAPLLLRELPRQPGLRLLDACAAPGGKTAHLLELADADVTALDISTERCERIRENLARTGREARVIAADAAEPGTWWDGVPFDGILLDAPCTASGIVRRHPDVRWLRRPGDIEQLAATQARLLEALWPLLRPGGRLVYCTCSVFRAEGEAQVAAFLAHNKAAVSRPAPGHLLPQSGARDGALPDNLEGDHDGFFYALLEKRAADA